MKNILFIPKSVTENEYLNNMADVFRSLGYEVSYFSFRNFIKGAFRNNFIFVNWLENQTRNSGVLGLVLISGFIILSKIFLYKLVYVRHNKISHNVVSGFDVRLNKIAIFLLGKVSKVVICHGMQYAKDNGLSYVPHPCYFEHECLPVMYNEAALESIKIPSDISQRMLIFGRIQRYKLIDLLLCDIDAKQKVVIAGVCDPEYKLELMQIINNRGLDVVFFDQFVKDDALNYLITASMCVVISTSGSSCIMSGAIIHALNLGAKVVVTDERFINELPLDVRPSIVHMSALNSCSPERIEPSTFYNNFSKASVVSVVHDLLGSR